MINRQFEAEEKNVNKKKKNPAAGIVLIILGAIVVLFAGGIMLLNLGDSLADNTEVYLDEVSGEGQKCYIDAACLTSMEPFSFYESYEAVGFYHVIDSGGNIYIVCMHSDDLADYESLYAEGGADAQPIRMNGISMAIDPSLKSHSLEDINWLCGEEYLDNFSYDTFMGYYYLFMGENPTLVWANKFYLILLFIGIILLAGGIFHVMPSGRKADGSAVSYPAGGNQGSPVYTTNQGHPAYTGDAAWPEPEINPALGIAGAVIGAAVGAIPWIIIGILGVISGWLGLLIIYSANKGYRLLGHGINRSGKIISGIIALLMVLIAQIIVYTCLIAGNLNEIMPGHGNTLTAFQMLIGRLGPGGDLTDPFAKNLGMGYGCVLIGMFYSLLHKRNTKLLEKNQFHAYMLKKKYRLPSALLCVILIPVILFTAFVIGGDNPLAAIIFAIISFLLIWLLVLNKQVHLSSNTEGFIYTDKKNKYKNLVPWNSIARIREPSPGETVYQIYSTNGNTYFLNSDYFEDFDQFVHLLKSKTSLEQNYI